MKEVYKIYGITDCPACLRAQADLMELEHEYVFIQTDFSKTYRESVKDEFSFPTFPVIVLVSENGERLIGGYDQLRLHIKSGDFSDELKHCSILKKN